MAPTLVSGVWSTGAAVLTLVFSEAVNEAGPATGTNWGDTLGQGWVWDGVSSGDGTNTLESPGDGPSGIQPTLALNIPAGSFESVASGNPNAVITNFPITEVP